MVKLAEVYKRLTPAANNNQLAIANQSTTDIINQVLSQHIQNAKEAKKICDLFEGGNLYQTSENIWNFLKYEVPYKVEPSEKQTTKTISRMMFDAMHGRGNDCKHYSGFTGAILSACGYKNWVYRFAGYSKYINVPTHVYCVANDGDGKIFIDAVISGFDLEKPYVLKIDKKINNDMSLYKLSGIGDIWDDLRSAPKRAADYAGDKARQAADAVKKAAEEAAKKLVEGVKTVTLALPRNAFLVLLRFNVHGWATGLKGRDWNQLAWWVNDFGGNRTDLMDAINAGAKNSRILGFDYNDVIYPKMLGSIGEPVTIASALATATPIIIKVSSLLDSAQKVADKVDNLGKKATSIAQTVTDAKDGFQKATGVNVSDLIWKKDAGTTGSKNSISTDDLKPTSPSDAKKISDALSKSGTTTKLDTKTMLLIGGGALALLLILKKK
jgi:hypothetical protein